MTDSATMELVRSGGPTVIAVVVLVGAMIALWRYCGKPMVDGLIEFAKAHAAASSDLKLVASSLAQITRDASDNLSKSVHLADQLAQIVKKENHQ